MQNRTITWLAQIARRWLPVEEERPDHAFHFVMEPSGAMIACCAWHDEHAFDGRPRIPGRRDDGQLPMPAAMRAYVLERYGLR